MNRHITDFSSFKLAVQAWLFQEGFSGTLNFVQFSLWVCLLVKGLLPKRWLYGDMSVPSEHLFLSHPVVNLLKCFKKEKLASHRDCESWALLQKIFLLGACMFSPEGT